MCCSVYGDNAASAKVPETHIIVVDRHALYVFCISLRQVMFREEKY
jgi:hypothetical protein